MLTISAVAQQMSGPTKVAGDVAAASTAVGSLLGFLPPLAALFTIVWTGIQIWAFFLNLASVTSCLQVLYTTFTAPG